MTREEAILHMTLIRAELKNSVGDLDEDIKAFDMAIKALEQELCGDCISRQAAIDEVRFGQSYITKISPDGTLEHLFDAENKALEEAVERIEQLPPVKPEQKRGKWEYVQYDGNPNIGNWHCSECHKIIDYKPLYKWEKEPEMKYCPNCGAKMEGEE